MEVKDQQKRIQNWFDQTYKTRGFHYLRPLEAYSIFKTLIAPKAGNRHLDVACGLGLMLKALEGSSVELHGIDLSEEAVKQCREYCPTATVKCGNAEVLPYESNHFDSITCLGSLERMMDRDQVIREQIRVARPGATLCFMVRNAENFTWKYILKPLRLYNRTGHQDALNLQQWKHLFERHGLEIQGIYPDHWPYYRFKKFILPWRKVDTGRLVQFPLALNNAYEFIFLMRKK